jgi:diacylglycerol kinase family enzyme
VVTKADRVAVVLNGNARQVTDELIESFDRLVGSGDVFLSRSVDEAHRIALDIVESGYPVVLTGGGDGTFVQMVTSITKEAKSRNQAPPRFGLLKLGTGNSLAWALGAGTSRKGVFADLQRLRQDGTYRDFRLIEAQDLLTPFAGAGFDALGLKHFHEVRSAVRHLPWVGRHATGAVSYAISIPLLTIPGLALRPRIGVRIVNRGAEAQRLDRNGQPTGASIPRGAIVFEGKCIAALVSTIPYWGFGARVFPFAAARPADRFCLRVVATNPLHIAVHMRRAWTGTYRHDGLLDFYVEDVELEFEEPTAIEIGGDPAGMTRSLRARLHPDPIKLIDYRAL